MEFGQKPTIKENLKAEWRPFLAKIALLGSVVWGANWYMYPENVTEMVHEDAVPLIGDELTVMTVNVHSWREDGEQIKAAPAEPVDVLDELQGALEEHDPDVVCMQEVTKGGELDELFDSGYNILHATTTRYFFSAEFGNAVMSKAPLQLIDVEKLPSKETRTPRNAILFELDTKDDKPLVMAATHFGLDQKERGSQAKKIMRSYGDVLKGGCGDFNSDDDEISQGALGPLQSRSNLQFNLPTFPAKEPTREIDHIMLECGKSAPFMLKTFDIGSDHKGVVQTFDIADC